MLESVAIGDWSRLLQNRKIEGVIFVEIYHRATYEKQKGGRDV